MDLYWERISAGNYETAYFTFNGYKYKVTGEGTDWQCYYMYKTKNPALRKWRPLRHGYSDRMKQAKVLCSRHAENPRRKFKFKGRETIGFMNPTEKLTFVEVVKDRKTGEEKEVMYGKIHLKADEFYESYSAPATYLGEHYFDEPFNPWSKKWFNAPEKEVTDDLTMANRSA